MATYRGTDGVIRVGANAVLEVQSFTCSAAAAIIGDNSLGDEWDTHLLGRKSWTASLVCNTDPADTTGQRALAIGASATVNVYPVGTANGRILLTGTATVTGVEFSSSHDNAVATVNISVTGNGALTVSTVG
jgi:predicted secreted protein